tara:strand:+ start:285 stop:506 length:222 start_codon:yes stop_codon:yes gene_type:complete
MDLAFWMLDAGIFFGDGFCVSFSDAKSNLRPDCVTGLIAIGAQGENITLARASLDTSDAMEGTDGLAVASSVA